MRERRDRMTLWCTGASSCYFHESKRCSQMKSCAPHTQPTSPQAGGRWCDDTLAPVSPGLSTCRWTEEGRFQQRRQVCRGCGHRQLPVDLMQNCQRKRDEIRKETANNKYEESFCSFFVENIDRKTRTTVRMTKAQLMSVRCDVINFLQANVFLIDTGRDN